MRAMADAPKFRADHIGSLLRPPALLAARAAFEASKIDAAALRAAEDEAIRAVVALQEEAGLEVMTDGEYRRHTYSDSFTTSGISGIKIELTEEDGWRASATHGHRMARRIPAVEARIEWRGPQNAADFAFTQGLTERTVKVTLPGPAYIHYRAGRAHISRQVYPDLDKFWSDLVKAYHQEMRSLADAGCRYLQIDETSLVKLGDERVRRLLAERGDDWRDLLRVYVEVLNAVAAGAPRGMAVAIHICRSQDPSWQATASYEPIAEAIFGKLAIGSYLLEWDGPRAGSFEPLRHLPRGKRVVLGLLAATAPVLETAEALTRRIEEASRYTPLDQLGLSPHCGFSTSAQSVEPARYELQRQKLALVVAVARQVWGTN
jgi:5-methyltetrahydropteroyltriglutamate--homocysteine methyltransferase